MEDNQEVFFQTTKKIMYHKQSNIQSINQFFFLIYLFRKVKSVILFVQRIGFVFLRQNNSFFIQKNKREARKNILQSEKKPPFKKTNLSSFIKEKKKVIVPFCNDDDDDDMEHDAQQTNKQTNTVVVSYSDFFFHSIFVIAVGYSFTIKVSGNGKTFFLSFFLFVI